MLLYSLAAKKTDTNTCGVLVHLAAKTDMNAVKDL